MVKYIYVGCAEALLLLAAAVIDVDWLKQNAFWIAPFFIAIMALTFLWDKGYLARCRTWLLQSVFSRFSLKQIDQPAIEQPETPPEHDPAETLRIEGTLREQFESSLGEYRDAVRAASSGGRLTYTGAQQLNWLAQRACGELDMYMQECKIDCPWSFRFTEPHMLEIGDQPPRMNQMNLASTAAFVARHCEFLAEFEKRAEKLKEHSSRIHAQNATLAE